MTQLILSLALGFIVGMPVLSNLYAHPLSEFNESNDSITSATYPGQSHLKLRMPRMGKGNGLPTEPLRLPHPCPCSYGDRNAVSILDAIALATYLFQEDDTAESLSANIDNNTSAPNDQDRAAGGLIQFDKNEWHLNTKNQHYLCILIDDFNKLKVPSGAKVYIRGHADSTGNEAYNRIISQRRALAAKRFMLEGGVPERDIIVEWYGSIRAFQGEQLDPWPVSNRRVEISVIKTGYHRSDMYYEEKNH